MGPKNTLSQISDKKEEVLNWVLFLANSIALSVLAYIAIPQAHKLVREYSAGVALICTISWEVDCAKWANWIADMMWATREDELRGTIKVINDITSQPKKKTPTKL